MNRWRVLVPLLLLVVSGLTVAWTRGRERRASVRVAPGPIKARVIAQAELVARDGIAEVRPRIDGTVLHVLVSEGDRVQTGQLLAELESEDLRANVARSEAETRAAAANARSVVAGPREEERLALQAELQAAREQLELAKDRARRSARLEETGVEPEATARDVSRAEQIAQAQLTRAEARLNQAKAGGTVDDIRAARERVAAAAAVTTAAKSVLDRTRLLAPVSGVVLSRHIDPGDTVIAARDPFPAFEIADIERTEFKLEAEEEGRVSFAGTSASMRAMRRASTPSAAIRAAPSSCSQAVAGGLVGARSDGGCGGLRNARFSCMAALHVWRRLGRSAQESVDDLAQGEQITELAERGCAVDGVIAQRCVGIAPVGPRRGNERSAAVRQDDEDERHAASLDAMDHGQRLGLERVALADDRHMVRNIAVVGSLSPLPSTMSGTTGC